MANRLTDGLNWFATFTKWILSLFYAVSIDGRLKACDPSESTLSWRSYKRVDLCGSRLLTVPGLWGIFEYQSDQIFLLGTILQWLIFLQHCRGNSFWRVWKRNNFSWRKLLCYVVARNPLDLNFTFLSKSWPFRSHRHFSTYGCLPFWMLSHLDTLDTQSVMMTRRDQRCCAAGSSTLTGKTTFVGAAAAVLDCFFIRVKSKQSSFGGDRFELRKL